MTENGNKTAGSAPRSKNFERPSLACDVAIVVFADQQLQVLLVERGRPPFVGAWALPGGFVEPGESPATAAARETLEETGIRRLRLVQVGAFGDPGRDPRGWVVSVAFLALTRAHRLAPRAGDDARAVKFFPLRRLPPLAFDHDQILRAARARLRQLAVLTPDLFDLLPRVFSADDLRQLGRENMGRRYDADGFGRALAKIPALEPAPAGPGERRYRCHKRRLGPADLAFLLNDRWGAP